MADPTSTRELNHHDKQQEEEEDSSLHRLHRTQEEDHVKLQSLHELAPTQAETVENTSSSRANNDNKTENMGLQSAFASATNNQGLKRTAEELAAKCTAVSGVTMDSGQIEMSSINVDMAKPGGRFGPTGYLPTSNLATIHDTKFASLGHYLTHDVNFFPNRQMKRQEKEAKKDMDQPPVNRLEVGSIDDIINIHNGNSDNLDPIGVSAVPDLDAPQEMLFHEPSIVEASSREGDQILSEFTPLPDILLLSTPNTTTRTQADSNIELVEATLIVETATDHDIPQQAQLVDPELLALQPIRGHKERECRRVGYVLIALSCAIVAISLGVSLGNEKAVTRDVQNSTVETNGFSTLALPPLANVQALYDDLPYNTKQSLSISNTPQRMAWEWLFDHQNITTLPEWKKRQIFAMATIYYSLEGPHWAGDFGKAWMNRSQDECRWNDHVDFDSFDKSTGGLVGDYVNVTSEQYMCKDGEVWFIGVGFAKLASRKPTIPPEIALLTSVTHIVFAMNDIRMPLSEFLPSDLFHMSNLSMLVLFSDYFYGTIPTELAYLQRLTNFLANKNSLSGSLPTELGLMTKLQSIALNENSITGRLPTELGLMTGLLGFFIPYNQLTGPIPSEMGILANISNLYLHGNYLTSFLPTELGLISNMQWLELFDNELTGHLPSELGLMTIMREIHLYETLLSGSLPTELGQLRNTRHFFLQSNNQFGPLPSELGLWTRLRTLSASGNAFNGALPSELGFLTHMTLMTLSDNHLAGTLPTEFGSLSILEIMTLSDNLFSGTMPSEFGSLTSLKILSLTTNNLSGSLQLN